MQEPFLQSEGSAIVHRLVVEESTLLLYHIVVTDDLHSFLLLNKFNRWLILYVIRELEADANLARHNEVHLLDLHILSVNHFVIFHFRREEARLQTFGDQSQEVVIWGLAIRAAERGVEKPLELLGHIMKQVVDAQVLLNALR